MTKRRSIKKILLWIAAGILVCIVTGGTIIYLNLDRLLTRALHNGFDANIVSDVYELKFENLNVNILTGSVRVTDVEMKPREKPLHDYPYVNSTFDLKAHKMILKNVDLFNLLRANKLHLEKIELVEPGIDFSIADSMPVFFPFKPSIPDTVQKADKKSLESYFLREFSMVNAYFHVVNTAKVREFNIQRINLSLQDMLIDRQPGLDKISYRSFDFSIGELTGKMESKKLRYINFKDFKVNIDSLNLEETPDTVIYHFADITTGIQNLDVQTADSLYHLTLESFKLSYKKHSIEFKNLSFKPNISDAAMQKRFTYRKEHFAATVSSIELQGVNFDSLLYKRKILIDNIVLDEASIAIFKDLTKPFPPDHHPDYLGQQILFIPVPLTIQHVKVTHANLVNREVTPSGGNGKANINRATVEVDNVTNLDTKGVLTIKADAYIENKAHAHLTMAFQYKTPQFSIDGKVDRFDLTDLNSLINSYAPIRIKKGIADGITFSGMVDKTHSTGSMKFLYHDLVVDMELEDKAKWKSTVLGLVANTYLSEANPASAKLPERIVHFEVERDPRKGYLSMMIKSVLDGIKETFVMSKENKQAYKEAKAEQKQKLKAEKKGE